MLFSKRSGCIRTTCRLRRLMPTMRADEFLEQGNLDGRRPWMWIMQAIEEWQPAQPARGVAVCNQLPCGPLAQALPSPRLAHWEAIA